MPGETTSARGGKPHAIGALRGFEMDLQLIGGLGGRANDVDLQARVATLVEFDTDYEHHTIRHFDSKLAAVGA